MSHAARDRVARCLGLDLVAVEVVEALANAGVETILLKGPATVRWLYAEDPSMRLYTDVDLLVRPASYVAAGEVMAALGFRDRLAGLRATEAAYRYEQVWDREPGEMVELHRSFFGVRDAEAFWELARGHIEPLDVTGSVVAAPDRVLGALLYALHAAQHGTERSLSAKPLEDLRRAVAAFEQDVWREAAALATSVGALDAFGVGLGLDDDGAVLARHLGVDGPASPQLLVRARGRERAGDRRLTQLMLTSGPARWRILHDIVLPSRAVLASRSPLARRGPVGLVLAYLHRWGVIVTGLPAAVLSWRRSLRAARTTGWRPEPVPSRTRRGLLLRGVVSTLRRPDPARLRAAWWTARAVRVARTSLRSRGPADVALPRAPTTRRRAAVDLEPTVRSTARLLGASCLESALARQAWLDGAGVGRDLVVGVTAPSAGFRAHAWLDGDADQGQFTEITRHPATSPPGRLPDFVIIGAAKAGSTSLWAYLAAHPDVFMVADKEPEFFNDETRWRRGVDWYRSLFAEAGVASVAGEASVRYATSRPASRDVPERMAAVLPDAKLVYLVRHPVDRMVSQWQHNRAGHSEQQPLEVALTMPRYRDVSCYATQLERFLRHYPAEQVHVVVSERLLHDRQAEMARLLDFLGVDPCLSPEALAETHHRSVDKRVPRAWMSVLLRRRALRAVHHRLRRLAPAPVHRAAQLVTRTPSSPISCPADLYAASAASFEDEVARLRPYVAGDFDGWGIA